MRKVIARGIKEAVTDGKQNSDTQKKGFMMFVIDDQLMEVKNTKGFKPKEW